MKYKADNLPYINQELLKYDQSKEWRITVTPWKEKRSLTSNGQIHLWFDQIAKQLGYKSEHKSDGYIKNSCKILFGIDILLSSETNAAQSVIRTLERVNYWDMDWSTKYDVVQGLTVTSIFETSEMKVFMDQMIFYWNDLYVPIRFKDK